MIAVPSLVKKWEIACEQYPQAKQALDSLTETSNPDRVKEWTKMAEKAAIDRRNHIEAMDIYEVHSTKCRYPLTHGSPQTSDLFSAERE